MTTVAAPSRLRTLRSATLSVALLVFVFIPVMQMLTDGGLPVLSKPALCGACLAFLIASLALLPFRWQARALLMTCITLLMLGAAEIVTSSLLLPATRSIYDWDDVLLYRTVPGRQKTFRRTPINGGQSSTVSINSRGYRGPEPDISDPDRLCVAVYGDSFIEAEYSNFEQTFGEQLSQRLAATLGRPVTVVNAGTNGYGPDQSLLRLEQELPLLKPQVAMLSVFADNDYGDLLRNKLFQLDQTGALQPNRWTRSPDCRHPGLQGRYEPTLWKLARNLIRGAQASSGADESFMPRWLEQCEREYTEYILEGNAEVHDLQADHYDADISLTPGVPSAVYKARLFEAILQRFQQACQRQGVQPYLLLIPSPADLIDNYDFCQVDRQRYPHYNARALTAVARTAALKLELPFSDLTEAFEKGHPGELYFRGGDNHWNDRGQRLAADIVAPQLAQTLQRRPSRSQPASAAPAAEVSAP